MESQWRQHPLGSWCLAGNIPDTPEVRAWLDACANMIEQGLSTGDIQCLPGGVLVLPGGVEPRRSFFDPPEVDYATAVENDPTIEEMWAKMAALGIVRDE